MATPQSEPSDSSSVHHSVSAGGGTSENGSANAPNDDRQTKSTASSPSGRGGWLWLLFWLLALAAVLAVVARTLMLLLKTPPIPNCEQVALQAGSNAPQQLYCAQKAASSGGTEDLIAALEVVASWPQEAPLYGLAAKSRDEWSHLLLAIARRKLTEDNNLEAALSLIKEIPENSSAHPQAQEVEQRWQNLHDQAQGFYQSAQTAMKKRDWSAAWDAIRKLQKFPHQPWQKKRSQQLVEQMKRERDAWTKLERARDRMVGENPQAYARAIEMARQIEPNTYARSPAQADISRWGRQLLNEAFAEIDRQNFDKAIRIAELVPDPTYLGGEAENLVLLARATANLHQEDTQTALGDRLPSLMYLFWEARAAANAFSSSTPYFPHIRQMQLAWQDHSEDLSQMQFASWFASLGYKPTLKMAAQQVQTISQQRPRRLHAQTLKSHWKKQIHRLEDKPLLQQAQQQATGGQVEDYQAAIELASTIEPQSPLHDRAQSFISQWRQQAMLLTDRRTIGRADELAQQEKYTAAVKLVANISTKSPLYEEAQERIQRWRTQAELAAHRAILKAGQELATQGQYTDAIIKVRTIAPGEQLYAQAQQAIARWLEARGNAR
ncbi:hypothetical protein [Geitlerinema sp. PCC 9228]|jgi:hypothetical protein|uniref:hypothetical protein n=1 Tax=Geitlerinema sp. PCC 9228 TaxID=111611 RepID=UPI0008F9C2F8|nr:hypothetical protein [Geitlerinema sp. PCC 9228]